MPPVATCSSTRYLPTQVPTRDGMVMANRPTTGGPFPAAIPADAGADPCPGEGRTQAPAFLAFIRIPQKTCAGEGNPPDLVRRRGVSVVRTGGRPGPASRTARAGRPA